MDSSKETTKYFVESIVSFLRSVIPASDNILGAIVAAFHILFGICIITLLITTNVNGLYYIYVIIWGLVIYSNYFFHGCIFSRVERHLFDNKKWCGPVSLFNYILEFFGITVDKDVANGVIKYLIAFPVCSIVILKIFFSSSILISVLLGVLWTPLLFIHSQKAIFESIKKPQKDLSDKIIAITGCTSGLGKEIINPLLDRGATVILLNRISEKSKSLYEELKDKNIVDIECDLTSLKSVKTACKKIRDEFSQGIDVLYINAGISNNPVTLTEDNYEIHIQTNYISHVLLINNVLDLLKKKNGKIINTSSIAYKIPFFTYNPLVFKKHPHIQDTHSQYLYQQSKLAMLLYLKSINSEINVINVQPGICSTELLHNSILSYPIKFLVNLISSSSKSGSKYLLNALTLNKYHEFVGPTILFMNFNTIDKSLINKIDSNKIYKETHKSLNIKSSKASDKAESSPDSQPRSES